MRGEPDPGDSSVERLTPRVRRLILLRHGQTVYNATQRMQGQLDTDLSDLGVEQAQIAGRAIATRSPLVIVSSDLRRAHETAKAIGTVTGQDVTTDERLRETDLGDWQGMTHTEVDTASPGARRHWRDDATWSPPAGESRVDVGARMVPVVAKLVAGLDDWGRGDDPDAPVVLVAHGGCIAALTARLLGLPVANWPILGGLANTAWVQLSGHSATDADDPVWRLDVWNASAESAVQ
ncbi:histidine phosphatase family protein [Gordonia sp. HY442]|uniref:histidine phosphatase family protein n=1 Tax=Gordonia zhenghanii TaxID=2911516 RepID=UPI001F42209B|nr:histidine phosphatase family protein [Gordonia zhenghanii]MCF8606474.1 histidine phosphatase family protein [Gordonia zhenghanii]